MNSLDHHARQKSDSLPVLRAGNGEPAKALATILGLGGTQPDEETTEGGPSLCRRPPRTPSHRPIRTIAT